MSYDTTQDELQSLFSEVGSVTEVFLPDDRATGRPRGFAFVEFTDKSAVTEAIQKFDGYQLNGRNINVKEAEERERRPARSFGSGSYDGPGGQGGHGEHGGRGGHGGPRRSKPKGSRRNLRSKIRDRRGSF